MRIFLHLFALAWLAVVAGSIFRENVHAVEDAPRRERQVVQPKWLTQSTDFFPIDKSVKVTSQNLQEAAEIRASIQSAVDEGRFAVGDSDLPQVETTTTPRPRWPFTLTAATDLRDQWSQRQQDWQRLWLEFLQNARRFFAAAPSQK